MNARNLRSDAADVSIRFRDSIRSLQESLRAAERRLRRLRKRILGQAARGNPQHPSYRTPITLPPEDALEPRVLIIAEPIIPQCLKYRVLQRQEALRSLGIGCTWVPWTDAVACRNALQTHTLAILYRVPSHQIVTEILTEARRLGVRVAWECDDLIFDESVLKASRALARLDWRSFRELLRGAARYRHVMLSCDFAIASTPELAAAMRTCGARNVHVVENGLDRETLDIAGAIAMGPPRPAGDATVRIAYGSGTSTHDVDFEEAAPAIANVLHRHPNVRLRLMGPLAVPPALARHGHAIERMPSTGFPQYLSSLAECDISIAPLEDYVFNDCKSSIKHLEASVLGLPSVCSPRPAFVRAIAHGVDGFLCEGDREWESALETLVSDAALRRRIGTAANERVRRSLAQDRVAREQVAHLVPARRPRDRVRVLSVNVFYSPQSFGGATLVAESVNRIMHDRHGMAVDVFTTVPSSVAPPYSLHRYQDGGITVLGMGMPDHSYEQDSGFDSPAAEACFLQALDATTPDVVHFHSIQGIGIRAVEACRRRGIPYAITLHDAWWICGRQFMIDRSGRYCGQLRIDPEVCATCVDSPALNEERMRRSRQALEGASALLAPSQFFADLHAANGLHDVTVNRNGIGRPDGRACIRRPGPIRFGYVGGNTPIKGFHLVREAFMALAELPATLVLVDNTLNLGFRSFSADAIRGIPNVELQPAYTRETIDEFFAGIDVLLFPTQWKESFGLTVREAIARNVWVIASDAGGVSEDIRPGINGTTIPFGDDGTALRAAIVDAVSRIGGIPVGSTVSFHRDGIRYVEEQAEELAHALRGCATGRRMRPLARPGGDNAAVEPAGPLIVSGMHRSGTSLLASILDGAGVHLGPELISPSPHNPHGHFEDTEMVEFHRRVLTANGIVSEGYTTAVDIPVPDELAARADSLVQARERTRRTWGWKDPRTTLFLDFWRQRIPHAKFLLVFRRPWEVADSLLGRGDLAFRLNPNLATDVWLRYNRAILQFARMNPERCVVCEATQVRDRPQDVIRALRTSLRIPLHDAPSMLDAQLFRQDISSERASAIASDCPEAYSTYLELRELSGSGSALPADTASAVIGGSRS